MGGCNRSVGVYGQGMARPALRWDCAMARQARGWGRTVHGLSRLVDAARDRTLPMGSWSIVMQIGGME
jgi:hypothetical protein